MRPPLPHRLTAIGALDADEAEPCVASEATVEDTSHGHPPDLQPARHEHTHASRSGADTNLVDEQTDEQPRGVLNADEAGQKATEVPVETSSPPQHQQPSPPGLQLTQHDLTHASSTGVGDSRVDERADEQPRGVLNANEAGQKVAEVPVETSSPPQHQQPSPPGLQLTQHDLTHASSTGVGDSRVDERADEQPRGVLNANEAGQKVAEVPVETSSHTPAPNSQARQACS